MTDTGLAAERTALAWRRTAVGAMANVVLFLHAAATTDWRPAAAAPFAAAAVLSVVVVISVRRSRILHTEPRDQWGTGRTAVATVAAGIIGVTCVAAGFSLASAYFAP